MGMGPMCQDSITFSDKHDRGEGDECKNAQRQGGVKGQRPARGISGAAEPSTSGLYLESTRELRLRAPVMPRTLQLPRAISVHLQITNNMNVNILSFQLALLKVLINFTR